VKWAVWDLSPERGEMHHWFAHRTRLVDRASAKFEFVHWADDEYRAIEVEVASDGTVTVEHSTMLIGDECSIPIEHVERILVPGWDDEGDDEA